MTTYLVSLPTSICINVTSDEPLEDMDADDLEELLFAAVLDQLGKYPQVDSRNLGYDTMDILSEYDDEEVA